MEVVGVVRYGDNETAKQLTKGLEDGLLRVAEVGQRKGNEAFI